eukprot:scaffold119_cov66-Skeletonema_marinoi.AAC.8
MALNRSLIIAVFIEAFLLQAEEQFSQMDFEAAGVLYEAAILSSKRHKFLSEEALANELAGYFYLDTGKKMKSIITSRKHFKSILNGVLLQKRVR